MEPSTSVTLQPILPADVERASRFLHDHLNSHLSPTEWALSIRTSWGDTDRPNHGFMLVSGDSVVGVNLAFYSLREIEGAVERFCNLAALCVREDHRVHAVRLIRALLRQRGYSFTDLSPSGNVVAIDERLGFVHLNTTTIARLNTPTRRPGNVELLTDLDEIEPILTDHDLKIFRDHRECLAARHVVLRAGDQICYIIFRIDRRKRLRLFASLLYVSEPDAYIQHGRHLGGFLLTQHRAPVTLVEKRVLGQRSVGNLAIAIKGRPKLFKSQNLNASQIDYLYSELTCVAW